jgi:hypothetical protein
MTNAHVCLCGRPAVTELVPFLSEAGCPDDGGNAAGVVYVFPYWCAECFRRKFGTLTRSETVLRQAVGMARARDMIQRERWGG